MKKNKKMVVAMSSVRGAAMVEYALLLVAVLILGAVGMKTLGEKVRASTEAATQHF